MVFEGVPSADVVLEISDDVCCWRGKSMKKATTSLRNDDKCASRDVSEMQERMPASDIIVCACRTVIHTSA